MEEFICQLSSVEYFDMNGMEASCAALFPDDLFSSLDTEASYAESYTKAFLYDPDEEEDETAVCSVIKSKILLIGHRRSGKKSIMQKVSPHWSLTMQSANKLAREDVTNSSFPTFQLYDVPGHLHCFGPIHDAVNIFGTYAAVIFVIDVQDDYMDTLQKLQEIVTGICRVNPNIKFDVFIHKVDNLSDADKIEVQRDIHQKTCDDLVKAGLEDGNLSFYFTSIYDHSILEAVSRVVQKLNPYLPTLENLLNIFTSFHFQTTNQVLHPQQLPDFWNGLYLDEQDESLFDTQSTSVIKLNNHTVLYMKKVNRYIALICILGMDIFKRRGLIDYNFCHFQEAVQEVFELWKQRKPLEITPNSMARHLNDLSTKYSHFLKDSKYQIIESPISGNSTGICINAQESSCE